MMNGIGSCFYGVLETDFLVFSLGWKLNSLSFLLVAQFNMLTESFLMQIHADNCNDSVSSLGVSLDRS